MWIKGEVGVVMRQVRRRVAEELKAILPDFEAVIGESLDAQTVIGQR